MKATVVGAGLGGALIAARLGQAGCEVDVYEGRGDPRARGIVGGRSINLAISTRGLYALSEVGLEQEILSIATPMRGRMIHGPRGELTYQPYGTKSTHAINSVSRGALNLKLIEAAARCEGVRLLFDRKCNGVDLETGRVHFVDGRGESATSGDGLVIGADGAFSAVRASMQRLDRFSYSQHYLEHGYKELSIPPAADGSHRMEKNALHIWPRRSFMMIALPNIDGSFTCTLFLPFAGETSFGSLGSGEAVKRFWESQFPDALAVMPTLFEDFESNPTSSLVTIRCGPWHYRDRLVLLGDAAHAVVPFYGQGANAAFEDCSVLAECLLNGGDLGRDLERYYHLRKEHADTLADLAVDNFLEMRDRTGSRLFLMKKKLESRLARWFPGWFQPLYGMVTFSRIPYGEAVRRSRRQWAAVIGIAGGLMAVAVAVITMLLAR